MRYLCDTNVISELVSKQPNTRVMEWITSLDPETVYLSVLTIGELAKGIEKLPASRRKDALYTWLHDNLLLRFSGRILNVDLDVILSWGSMIAKSERAGKPLPAVDSLIAATALYHHCILATRNVSDFENTGINVVNPWAAEA